MEFTTALFYVFSAVLIGAAFRVVTARNPVHAVLFLVLAFFNAAGLWMLLQAEFLAIVLVLVYIGAVMVLFLFVVMMLDINMDKLRQGFWRHFPLAATVGVVIVLEMATVLLQGFWLPVAPVSPEVSDVSNTKALGMILYTEYIYAFEVAAVILLLGIVAAVVLTLRKGKTTKRFDPGLAVKVNKKDRVRIVHMQAESSRSAASLSPNLSPAGREGRNESLRDFHIKGGK